MTRIAWLMFSLFFPACLGILGQVIWYREISHQLLASGFFLFSIDQARMAVFDLDNISKARKSIQDQDPERSQLDRFAWITISTIVIELIGFYLATRWLGWGIIIVLLSQIWFNAQATIEIQPSAEVFIQSRKIKARIPVLIADAIAMLLIALWMSHIASLGIVLSLWGMALSYAAIKYALVVRERFVGDRQELSD